MVLIGDDVAAHRTGALLCAVSGSSGTWAWPRQRRQRGYCEQRHEDTQACEGRFDGQLDGTMGLCELRKDNIRERHSAQFN